MWQVYLAWFRGLSQLSRGENPANSEDVIVPENTVSVKEPRVLGEEWLSGLIE
jgi:hypothetical protein